MTIASPIKKESLHRAWAEISLSKLKANVEACRSFLRDGTELMCVVKANCYGHGIEHIIPFLEKDCGVKWFAVSNLVEAIELRELGVSGEILVLGYTPPSCAPEIVRAGIIQTITDLDYAVELPQNCPEGEKIRCHLAVDTGMTRLGIRYDDADTAKKIYRLPGIGVEGIFTHLAAADSNAKDDFGYTIMQVEKLESLRKALNRRRIDVGKVHFLNSAASTAHFAVHSDFARVGIMLYGLTPSAETLIPAVLEPVMELKASVAQVRTVPAGVDISYGRTFTTDRETRVAVVTIGYADGYPRLLSGKAEVLIKGKRAKVLGRICMDQLMIDVTDIEGVKPGDVVTLFGHDGDEQITADELAEMIGTIGYEIVCGISPRVPRIVVE